MKVISIKKNSGVTYLEVVLALAIVAIITLAFARMFLTYNVSVTSSRLHTLAANWAADQMEEIKSMPYGDIKNDNFSPLSRTLGGVKEFERTVNIAVVEGTEDEGGFKEVEIIVSWEELENPRMLRIVSFVADY
ncbi:MAG: type IV pilus modification PilV family protein [Elusimicrobiota bacterium]